MYNRYIPGSGGYTRVAVKEPSDQHGETGRAALRGDPRGQQHSAAGRPKEARQDFSRSQTTPLGFLGGEDKNAGMAGILKSLHLEELDSGDVLLLLIILFLFLEGDNIELVITLGLMLLLGLGDEKKEDQKE